MTERRKDYDGRRRIEQLEKRYRRITELLVGGLAALSLAMLIGFIDLGRQSHRVSEQSNHIQSSRIAGLQSLCEQRNQDHVAIVDFVAQVAPSLRRTVAASFPVTKDCKAYAEAQASTTEK